LADNLGNPGEFLVHPFLVEVADEDPKGLDCIIIAEARLLFATQAFYRHYNMERMWQYSNGTWDCLSFTSSFGSMSTPFKTGILAQSQPEALGSSGKKCS